MVQMKRERIKELKEECIEAAKTAGKHIGRPKTQVIREDVHKLLDNCVPKAKAARVHG